MGVFRACLLVLSVLLAPGPVRPAFAESSPILFADQGESWTPDLRAEFYSRDQGSKMIPLAWLRALSQANGQRFLSDSLARYGYLPKNPADSDNLPVGFTAPGPAGTQTVGMTCAACHTRQLVADGKAYRIDGGPAFADFQSLLNDLDLAVGAVLSSEAQFAPFAAAVLGDNSDPADVDDLKREVQAWFLRFDTLIKRAMPTHPWGPARLDAISMIFNRVTGLDLGEAPSLMIADNIKPADAPVRYPFLWNAPRQDETQWSGFAKNGDELLALNRNLGEVFGVFGVFQPRRDGLFIRFLENNSANFDGLTANERLVQRIGPPKWPWKIDAGLAAKGKAIFERPADQGGCHQCHGITPGEPRLSQQSWATPIQNVGTDNRQFLVLSRTASTGVLRGAFIPVVIQKPLAETDAAIDILAVSVVGSIAEHAANLGGGGVLPVAVVQLLPSDFLPPLKGRLPRALRDLEDAFKAPGRIANALAFPDLPAGYPNLPAPARGAYEARVLQGIWAVAPYLHNGAVPTLAELLKPAAQRVEKFKIGPAYDTTNVGLAADQPQSNFELETSGCPDSDPSSGNSRCGHEFGVNLTDDEKKALLEYLKML
jgi:mono/diheme cytochrome c family protein